MKTLYKFFVFSDVHGEYDALISALSEAGYNPSDKTHRLISVGDNFDRGSQSYEVYRFLKQQNAICVKGNHDCFFEEYLKKGMDGEFVLFNILHNGLGATINSFTKVNDTSFNVKRLDEVRLSLPMTELTKFLENMPLYYETEHFVFVHAGLKPTDPNWKNIDEHYALWDIEDSWRSINYLDKYVVIGHHHAFRVREQMKQHGTNPQAVPGVAYELRTEDGLGIYSIKSFGNTDENAPVRNDNKIAIDGCTNLTHKVNVLVFEDYEIEDKPTETKEIHVESKGTEYYAQYGDINTTIRFVNPANYTYTETVGDTIIRNNIW